MIKTKLKIQPRGRWILVRPIEESSKKTEYGLLLPANEKTEQKAQGIVEAMGNEVNDLDIGDQVIYGAFAGENIKTRDGGKEVELKLLLDEDIIAWVK